MKTLKVGGVPEHFNLPWHLCIENDEFKNEDINVIWKDFPDGTGAMTRALRSGEIDVAVLLTEGAVKDIISGNEAKIVQSYIGSSLIWGIHVDANSEYQNIQDLEGKKVAISRVGSGSELMAYVNAQNQGWDLSNLEFEIVGDINGAIEALKEGRADYFMWEHFTTKPLVDNSTFRRVADCPTPWPCFVIAVKNKVLKFDYADVRKMTDIVNKKSSEILNIPGIDKVFAERYEQKIEDIRKWMEITSWSQHQISEEDLEEVQQQLLKLDLISNTIDSSCILYNL
ncbi:ABC-type nitrate/sulfonate/bicarbonate transport system, substrate-binding protein [Zunongwangia mangrovi]|uniref:ABC-type nitrate/sulfonate/bicarbonate transport system, substrate-binding protein n=1 Tax=Zunongwangia mangrovi TaxID=1334022 RepID=A0A1I1G3Y8_9FLAO|nr:substrate-binding domain-containing protein [Zunongwangia mangrovi]SFC06211.1 ABC-type nitrate/sulfonate/bicarbonate transport system, substrate-binding protein [Zunongwangia mangrovi]